MVIILLKAPLLLLTMVYIAVFTYVKPYQMLYINLLEVFTLVDIMMLLIIASTNRFKVSYFKYILFLLSYTHRIQCLQLVLGLILMIVESLTVLVTTLQC